MTLTSVAELISIGALIPLLEVISDSNNLANTFQTYEYIFNFFNVTEKNSKTFIVTAFCILIAISGGFRIYQIKLITKFSFNIGLVISYKIYENIM